MKPTPPLKSIAPRMARGMLSAAFSTSSARWTLASAPTKVATFPRKPTQYESPWVGHPPSFSEVSHTEAFDPISGVIAHRIIIPWMIVPANKVSVATVATQARLYCPPEIGARLASSETTVYTLRLSKRRGVTLLAAARFAWTRRSRVSLGDCHGRMVKISFWATMRQCLVRSVAVSEGDELLIFCLADSFCVVSFNQRQTSSLSTSFRHQSVDPMCRDCCYAVEEGVGSAEDSMGSEVELKSRWPMRTRRNHLGYFRLCLVPFNGTTVFLGATTSASLSSAASSPCSGGSSLSEGTKYLLLTDAFPLPTLLRLLVARAAEPPDLPRGVTTTLGEVHQLGVFFPIRPRVDARFCLPAWKRDRIFVHLFVPVRSAFGIASSLVHTL
ncbi:hypothetical protein KC338_g199 [Hortaea werneckii]|nr:hypothetical protein KC338_g199 [Hortaea werneckii]